MRKVISLSLWGEREVYLRGALEAVGQAAEFYPGWELWFHLGQDVPIAVERELNAGFAQTRRMPFGEQFSGEFWRFLPASDPSVDVMISRDTDSKFTAREAAAVQEWLESGLKFHIMRDHPGHHPPIMAGMWGCRDGILSDMEGLVANWKNKGRYGGDQRFLGRVIYPRVKGDALIHSEIVRFRGEQPRPFPVRRDGLDFVGKAFRGDALVRSQENSLATWIAAGEQPVTLPLPWTPAGRVRRFSTLLRGRLERWRRGKGGAADAWG